METYNISEAKAQLSAIIEKVAEKGEEVIISKAGRPVARLTRFEAAKQGRQLDLFKGKIVLENDWDQWPEDLAQSLSIVDKPSR